MLRANNVCRGITHRGGNCFQSYDNILFCMHTKIYQPPSPLECSHLNPKKNIDNVMQKPTNWSRGVRATEIEQGTSRRMNSFRVIQYSHVHCSLLVSFAVYIVYIKKTSSWKSIVNKITHIYKLNYTCHCKILF